MIATDLKPFRIVEDLGFRHFVHCLDPQYILPSGYTLKNVLLKNIFEEIGLKLRMILKKITYCAVSIDCWTSLVNDQYLTITCHFVTSNLEIKSVVLSTYNLLKDIRDTSVIIEKTLLEVLTYWDILGKTVCFVTKNDDSMIRACESLKKPHLPCFDDTLSLIVQDALSEDRIKDILAKSNRIVTFFKSSSTAYAKLKLAQGTEPINLKKEMPTRWNSCYEMISRILEIKDVVSETLLSIKGAPSPLGAEEISALMDLKELLEPFDSATNLASANNIVTISHIIPASQDIYRRLANMNTSLRTKEGQNICLLLMSQVSHRLFPYEKHTAARIATLLDPRFKKEGFRNNYAAEQAVLALENQVATTLHTCKQYSDEKAHDQRHTMYSFMKEKHTKEIESSKMDAVVPIQQYFEAEHAQENLCPLEFWKAQTSQWEPMLKCTFKYLCIPAVSTDSERMFCKTGAINSDRRAILKPPSIDMLLFVRKNQWVLDT
ncbi:zinc finger BED domain-containing protein 4-like [Drosophila sulfurigaster albostrigata]|uniref:zinc finger BED domain-containing protein 4-like n=1 Tax=Drosophila sulfurigaster albostrigata TaxID=89887 RepID=UPI002D21C746|nr:zinc finger BED domain-containing protein 4-like [Drosophila sulfurigaster albostrigata]